MPWWLSIIKAGSVGDWFGVAAGLIKLANGILAKLKEESIREDERRKEFAEETALLVHRLGVQQMVNEKLDRLSDDQLRDDLAAGR